MPTGQKSVLPKISRSSCSIFSFYFSIPNSPNFLISLSPSSFQFQQFQILSYPPLSFHSLDSIISNPHIFFYFLHLSVPATLNSRIPCESKPLSRIPCDFPIPYPATKIHRIPYPVGEKVHIPCPAKPHRGPHTALQYVMHDRPCS